ncbi:peptide ABC transporter substrate-binding protein [bacterium]|nr:MAG: peptide ABC transporter substrate-binding protein [bacterium]
MQEVRKPIYFKTPLFLALFFVTAFVSSCTSNNPYRESESSENILYTTFVEPPKHLDPAKSYSSDEYEIIGQIYEPPVQYHYLKRPYELIALTAAAMPMPAYFDAKNKRLADGASPEKVVRAVYEINIKKGVMYQEHPAFAKKNDGRPMYNALAKKDLEGIENISDFPFKGTRELTADDYALQIMRLADPLIESPVLPILEKYILGLKEYSDALRADLARVRNARKKAAGTSYNQTIDERTNPIVLEYKKHSLPGVQAIDKYTYRIILKTKYPQFIYWLAMPFFAPMPEEALSFYAQGALAGKNITLNRFPVGTGAYMMEKFNPNMEIILLKNPNFNHEAYPVEGEKGDAEKGLLKDADKKLPFIDKVVFKLEKEAIPRWNKFLQGYYDSSGISSETFDTAVSVGDSGRAELSASMKDKAIRLLTSVRPSTYYAGFNMLDETVGGYSIEKQKLRQAISIALDFEENIEIFNNGRGVPAMSALPPGIFGRLEDEEGINPYVYEWDAKKKRANRRSIDYAKKLMAEAGYPDGRGKDGQPLVITFDNPWTGPDFTPIINWYAKRFNLIGIQLENRTTDYNRFQEKMMKGSFQFFSWGWNADYPDPENFFFLLASAGGKVKFQGENVANYSNPEFDALFKKMENMNNSPERLSIIKRLNATAQKDAPWVWGYHPVAFGLYQGWLDNVKPNAMANNELKYYRIDAVKRKALRVRWNSPVYWPVAVVVAVIAAGIVWTALSARRKRR